MSKTSALKCVELCAGAGGSSIGLEQAGFRHEAAVERDRTCCDTLSLNRPKWNVVCSDLRDFDGSGYGEIDLLSGGMPCPPFSVAGRQLGEHDARDCFPHALRIVKKMKPRAVMFENVPGMLQSKFAPYRDRISVRLSGLGYASAWFRVVSAECGVPQYRPRTVLVGVRGEDMVAIPGIRPGNHGIRTVAGTISDIMGLNGWAGLESWKKKAGRIAPTLTGGSEKHGGPDLGPTRARAAWAEMGIDGLGIANEPPAMDFEGMPRLTIRMVARIQAFPDSWEFAGRKTKQHRQIGNALPPPVSKMVGQFIRSVLI